MGKYTTYVGMDVHSRSISANAVEAETGVVITQKFVNCPSIEEIVSWIEELAQPVYCAYESGCIGFYLARKLREHGIDCDIIAVSTLPKSVKDKMHKCDRLDAKAITREILNPLSDYTIVRIPDETTEAGRELARAYESSVKLCKEAKQTLVSFLQRHGFVWNERTKTNNLKKRWTRTYWDWIKTITFEDVALKAAFDHYIRQVHTAQEEVKTMKELLCKQAQETQNAPYIDALMCLKGIDIETAYLARVEVGDFLRFDNPAQIACWLGVTPKDASSGETNKHGKITKAGNRYLRCALIESMSSLHSWKDPYKQCDPHASLTSTVQLLALKANERIYERWHHLTGDLKKNKNKAKVAIVHELIKWILVIGKQVELEQRCISCA